MKKYTHKGLFCGIVPVYLEMSNEDAPLVSVRWPILEPVMDIVEIAFGCFVFIMSALNPDYDPMYPIKITGEYNGEIN